MHLGILHSSRHRNNREGIIRIVFYEVKLNRYAIKKKCKLKKYMHLFVFFILAVIEITDKRLSKYFYEMKIAKLCNKKYSK